jgi:hypothetical protein
MKISELKQIIRKEISAVLNEAVKIYDIKPKDKIKKGTIVVAKHGTPDVLAVKRFPIHLGSGEQVESRIDSLWGSYPLFREYEVTVKLTNPCPYVIMDVDKGVGHDTTDFAKYGDYNEFIYHNTVEGYPDEENNLSIFIVDFQKSYISMKLIDTIKEEVSKALNSMRGMKKMSPGYYKGKYKGVEFEVVKVMEVDASTRNKWYWLVGKEGGDDWYSKKEIAKYYAMQWIEEEL